MVQSYVLHWFQSTPPRWGRRIRITRLRMRFNPRPHARGDTRHLRLTPSLSSFNPRPHARGDVKSDQFTRLDLVSIHAPHEGRHFSRPRISSVGCFNPRPHARGDKWRCACVSYLWCFNPRPHTRGDINYTLRVVLSSTFQSTPPHEGRHLVI